MKIVKSIEELEALYGEPSEPSKVKVVDHMTADYQKYIEASPFCVMATSSPAGLDCSPRGDKKGFAHIHDSRTLWIPDRRGNNRVDSLRNVLENPQVGLLFFVPGSCTTLRVNGKAEIHIDPELLSFFAVDGKCPRSIMVIGVEEVYFQCSRALLRSELWNPDLFMDSNNLPSVGTMLSNISSGELGGERYDREWKERASKTMW